MPPRCQRTFRRLPATSAVPDASGGGARLRWVCPYCPEGEIYEVVRAPDLLAYARLAESACGRDFGLPPDAAAPFRLVLGLHPECVRETGEPPSGPKKSAAPSPLPRRYDLYLQRGSDAFQLRLQIGHEMFHRVCSRGQVFHWTHEMLACWFAVRMLRRGGLEEYADQMEYHYRHQAESLAPRKLIAEESGLPGDGIEPGAYYGRAFTTGADLEAAVGAAGLTRLARIVGRDGATPDIAAWLATLPDEKKAEACGILGITVLPSRR